jgi:hypothetical protein
MGTTPGYVGATRITLGAFFFSRYDANKAFSTGIFY